MEASMNLAEMIVYSYKIALIDYERVVVLKEKDGDRYLPMYVGATQVDLTTAALKYSVI